MVPLRRLRGATPFIVLLAADPGVTRWIGGWGAGEMLLLDIAPTADVSGLYATLGRLEAQGVLEFDEGVRPPGAPN